jgi:uncharacterized protein
MNKRKIIQETANFVKSELYGEETGHDWWHVYRVWRTASTIGKEEHADLFIVELAALLHDIADWKFNSGDEDAAPRKAREALEKLNVEEETINHVCKIIKGLSFKGAGIKTPMQTKEGEIVQDADRLEAIGAIGIARAFASGAKFGETIYDPTIKVPDHATAEEYKNAKGKKGRTTINHFYEKLLLLKDLMNTKTGKKIAEKRHKYMEQFLEEFYREWDGKA